jgi:hypothetical protein
MNSLTEVAYQSRRIIKYGGLSLIAFSLIWWMGSLAIKLYLVAFPPYIAPTVRFGILPKMVFPEKEFEKKTFSLELSNDNWPKFPDQSKVFMIYRSKSIIGALEEAKKTAKLVGFTGEPKEIRIGVYEFSDLVSNKKMTINVLTGNFDISYPYLSDQLLLSPDDMPSKEEAVNYAKNYLDQAGKLFTDLDSGDEFLENSD